MKNFLILLLVLFFGCFPENEIAQEGESLVAGDVIGDFEIWDVSLLHHFIANEYFPSGNQTVIFYLFDRACGDCYDQSPAIVELWQWIEERPEYYLVCIGRGEEDDQQVYETYWQELAERTGTATTDMPLLYWDKNRQAYNTFASSGVPRLYVVSPSGIVQWETFAEAAPVSAQELIGHLEAAL